MLEYKLTDQDQNGAYFKFVLKIWSRLFLCLQIDFWWVASSLFLLQLLQFLRCFVVVVVVVVVVVGGGGVAVLAVALFLE